MSTHQTSQECDFINGHLQDELDLLIDNELSREQQLRLFEQLDETPGGWRLCAQTFLEERLLQHQLQSQPKTIPLRTWTKDLGLAACAIAALVLTFLLGKTTGSSSDESQPIATAPTSPLVIPPSMVSPIDYEGVSDQGELIYSTRYELPEPLLHLMVQTGNRVEQRTRTVQLTSNTDDNMELPLVETRMFFKSLQ